MQRCWPRRRARRLRGCGEGERQTLSDIAVIVSDMKETRVTVRFPAELRQRLKVAARRSGARESDLVREAVEERLATEDAELTPYDYAKKAGLIGAVRQGPRDLSTNRKHFEGFGRS